MDRPSDERARILGKEVSARWLGLGAALLLAAALTVFGVACAIRYADATSGPGLFLGIACYGLFGAAGGILVGALASGWSLWRLQAVRRRVEGGLVIDAVSYPRTLSALSAALPSATDQMRPTAWVVLHAVPGSIDLWGGWPWRPRRVLEVPLSALAPSDPVRTARGNPRGGAIALVFGAGSGDAEFTPLGGGLGGILALPMRRVRLVAAEIAAVLTRER